MASILYPLKERHQLLCLLTAIVQLERASDGGSVHPTVESGMREAKEIFEKVERYLQGWEPEEWQK